MCLPRVLSNILTKANRHGPIRDVAWPKLVDGQKNLWNQGVGESAASKDSTRVTLSLSFFFSSHLSIIIFFFFLSEFVQMPAHPKASNASRWHGQDRISMFLELCLPTSFARDVFRHCFSHIYRATAFPWQPAQGRPILATLEATLVLTKETSAVTCQQIYFAIKSKHSLIVG